MGWANEELERGLVVGSGLWVSGEVRRGVACGLVVAYLLSHLPKLGLMRFWDIRFTIVAGLQPCTLIFTVTHPSKSCKSRTNGRAISTTKNGPNLT